MEKTSTWNCNLGESVNIVGMDTPKKAQENISVDCQILNPLDSMENNHKLPAEVLVEIFKNLSHTEKLISRLVCTDWNREISSILAKGAYFKLTTVDSHETILDSQVSWTKIKISDSPAFSLPTKITSLVTAIVLEVSGSDMRESMRILNRFPQLIDLEVNILGGHLTKREDFVLTSEQFQVLRSRFRERAAKLWNLTITFPFGKFSTLLESLRSYFADAKCLIQLTFREQRRSASELDKEDHSQLTAIINTISKSSRTLKHLELHFVSKIQEKLFTKLISTLSTLKDLKLESFLIHSDPTKEMPELDFQIHQDFLKTQLAKGAMKRFSLPWCSNASLCQDFLRCVPQNIKFVANVCKEHVTDEFYSSFLTCETMAIQSRNLSMFNRPCPSIRKFYYCLIDYEDDLTWEEDTEFYKNMGNSLINVVEFYVVRPYHPNLQHIIENFQQLRILEIHCGASITDDDVSGVQEDYTYELNRTKRLYLNQNIPDRVRYGIPLSSLKCLEKLTLLGTCVTDVGIYFGLQFGSTLKHMTFDTDEKISDWGLHWLGAGNPSLESFDCSFKTGENSSDGVENLRKQIPMIEATGKFKLVAKKA